MAHSNEIFLLDFLDNWSFCRFCRHLNSLIGQPTCNAFSLQKRMVGIREPQEYICLNPNYPQKVPLPQPEPRIDIVLTSRRGLYLDVSPHYHSRILYRRETHNNSAIDRFWPSVF